jgi:hypothetical protein
MWLSRVRHRFDGRDNSRKGKGQRASSDTAAELGKIYTAGN